MLCKINKRYETINTSVKIYRTKNFKKKGKMDLFTIGFAICLLSGIGCFWLFYKCIDWFEKI